VSTHRCRTVRTSGLWLLPAILLACDAAPERVPPNGDASSEPAGANVAERTEDERAPVVFLGTSLTAGLGVDPAQAYPALIQEKIDSAGLPFRVVNAGVSGETSAGGLRRIAWLAEQPIDVLVLELGANDGLRGHDPESTRANLQAIIDTVRAHHPDAAVVIAGMEAPPNLGDAFTSRFRALFPALARANGAALIPFLLDGVAAVPELNQSDGIHPSPAGHRVVAETVWRALEPLLLARASPAQD